MSISNASVSAVSSVAPVAAPVNASKSQAGKLSQMVIEHRQDKSQAGARLRSLNNLLSEQLMSGSGTKEEVRSAVALTKAAVLAALDRLEQRATSLIGCPRGTTGKGGIHRDDVVTELFAPQSRANAIAANTAALKKAGIAS